MKIHTRAPLRLGLAGGGTDLSPFCDEHGGAVLNATIDRFAYAFLETNKSNTIDFHASDLDIRMTVSSDVLSPGPLQLHQAAYFRVMKEFNNGEPLPCSLSTYCEAPPGSGLGSSSTMVVAIVGALLTALRVTLSEYDIARLAFSIEREDAGLSGGRQDQYAATFGGFNFMEFLPNDLALVNPLRVKRSIISELESSIVLFYTGVSRSSAVIISQQVSNLNERDEVSMSAMHDLKRDAFEMKESLLKGNITKLAKQLNCSWAAKQKTAKGITTPSIEAAMSHAFEQGAIAGKVSGAGGGGFITFLCDPEHRLQVSRALKSLDGEVIPFSFTRNGVESWSPNDQYVHHQGN